MIQKIVGRLVASYFKLISKFRPNDQIIDVFTTLSMARTILVCMPDKLEDFGVARRFIGSLMKNFPKAQITFLTRDVYRNLLDKANNTTTLFISSTDISFIGLPVRHLQQRVKQVEFDLAIDLNNEFHLISTYLCQKSGAPLRVCLENRNREPFFNFRIRTKPKESLENKYRNLIKYLGANVQSVYTT